MSMLPLWSAQVSIGTTVLSPRKELSAAEAEAKAKAMREKQEAKAAAKAAKNAQKEREKAEKAAAKAKLKAESQQNGVSPPVAANLSGVLLAILWVYLPLSYRPP